jgi:two-component sensor histidine kinase
VAVPRIHLEAASTLAVIASAHEPLLLLDGELTIIAASESFCRAFGIDPITLPGTRLPSVGAGEWGQPQIASMLEAIASGSPDIQAYETDLTRNGKETRRLVVNARKLHYGDPEAIRLLVAFSDVTDARASERLKDDLIREKAVLLQEVQHRVANSLQIIASILLQTARGVQSEETRSYLQDAHGRVLSIAAVQRQLSASQFGRVALRPYLTQLCRSLGASMIRNHDQISIVVGVDDSATEADASVSLGLIVTELVINALKHAFPGSRHGTIAVDYSARGPQWTLSVSDDGVGMDSKAAKPGLGTGIIEALARQLQARIEVVAGAGTTVLITHSGDALVGETTASA